MTSIRFATFALALLAATPLAWTHDNATLDTIKAPHGGQLRMAGIYHFELVVAPLGSEAKVSPVVVFVTDHADTRLPTAGATGSATLLSGGKKVVVVLKPDADNRMKGEGLYLPSADLKAIVSITMAGAQAESARFTPLAKSKPGSHDGHK